MSKHGLSQTKIYRVFSGILSRCNDENNPAYKNYGGRGIKCEWNNFEEFYSDIKDIYIEGYSIDRVNNNGNYCKSNVRFVTRKQQQRNTRKTVIYKGKSLAEWSEILGIKLGTLHARIYKGWDMEQVVGIKKRKELRGKYIR